MRGGTIIVDGNAGNEIGLLMQEGVIAIGGQAGDMIGFNMTGGTVLVLGNAGIRPGAGMHGGTIALFGPNAAARVAELSVRPQRRSRKSWLPFCKNCKAKRRDHSKQRSRPKWTVYIGDQIADGTGEILTVAPLGL